MKKSKTNTTINKRTTVTLSVEEHRMMSLVSADMDLELNRVIRWGIQSLTTLSKHRTELSFKNADTEVTKALFFLDILSKRIE